MNATAAKEQLIFICDDDSDIAEVTTLILERDNYKVQWFAVCEGIVDAAEKEQPALILLDLWMPDMGGEKVVLLLKRNSSTRHIPVYLFSAVRDVEQVVGRCGADGFIPKPYDIEELEAVIEKAVVV